MACNLKEKKPTIDYSKIGYYGKPITELSRDELLAAVAELDELYKESQRKNKKYQDVLGKKKLDSL